MFAEFVFRHPSLFAQNPLAAVGASHGSDIPFWFKVLDGGNAPGDGNPRNFIFGAEEVGLATTLLQYVANFAASGSPNGFFQSHPSRGFNLTEWPAWSVSARDVMVLDTSAAAGCAPIARLRDAQCEFWSAVPDSVVPTG